MNALEELKQKVITVISKGETNSGINLLIHNIQPQSRRYTDIVVQSSRYQFYFKELSKGVREESTTELNQINQSILNLLNDLEKDDLNNSNIKTEIINADAKISAICNLVNNNYDLDLKHTEGDWDLDSVVNENTILIVLGGHFYCELLDRLIGYYLQNEINLLGDYSKLQRAILGSDMHYEQSLKLEERYKESITNRLAVLSIGGLSINSLSSEIIINQTNSISDKGINMTYQDNSETLRVALWGNSAFKTRMSVENFIKSEDKGLTWFLSKVWKS